MEKIEGLNDGEACKHCLGLISIRMPVPSSGCDHLYYPDNCKICKNWKTHKRIKIKADIDLRKLIGRRVFRQDVNFVVGKILIYQSVIMLCPNYGIYEDMGYTFCSINAKDTAWEMEK